MKFVVGNDVVARDGFVAVVIGVGREVLTFSDLEAIGKRIAFVRGGLLVIGLRVDSETNAFACI